MSSSMMLPKPWQVAHAPKGLLKENRRGCGSSYGIPQRRHSNRSLKTWTAGSPPAGPSSTANAAPPPSA
jgi:hypothetical protein